MKKGDLTWDTIGKILIALAILVFIILMIFLLKDKSYSLLDRIKDILAFGGG